MQIPVEGEWKFYKGDLFPNEMFPDRWDVVQVPHTWNVGDGQAGSRDGYYRGTGIYAHNLNVPEEARGKRVFLRFEGVSNTADIYLNREHLGNHTGAFTAFCFEITNRTYTGNYNTLIVKANNAYNENMPPLSGDFTLFGGLYRPVSLLILDPICFSPMNNGSSGITIRQSEVSEKSVKLEFISNVDNGYSVDRTVRVRMTLLDVENKAVVTLTNESKVPRGESRDIRQQITIDNPVLWDGIDNPYLYRARFELMQGNQVLDTISQPVGIRSFRIDPEKGFFLNGKPYKIKGVNKHQDRQGKGWAISRQDLEEDVDLILEMGANAVRAAHYPHSDYFYTLCDRKGLLVWAENPLVDLVTDSLEFEKNAKQQMTELIRQQMNHPSIIFWSLFNELNQKEGLGNPVPIVMELNRLAHEEDPSRPTIGASNIPERPENQIPDFIAVNTYPGWYVGKPSDMQDELKKWNKMMLKKGVCVSEYGAGASIHQHEENMKQPPLHNGKWHPEEWQSMVHEENYKQIKKSKFTWGSFVWNMFDFASAGRNEGDTVGINDKGLVTYDRKIKKDAYYFYKANWSDEPFVRITGSRFVERENPKVNVKAYSNCEKARLSVNGKDLGEKTGKDGILEWKNITLNPGPNQISVSSPDQNVSDRCEWILKPKEVVSSYQTVSE